MEHMTIGTQDMVPIIRILNIGKCIHLLPAPYEPGVRLIGSS
jgi:hypothetical protein